MKDWFLSMLTFVGQNLNLHRLLLMVKTIQTLTSTKLPRRYWKVISLVLGNMKVKVIEGLLDYGSDYILYVRINFINIMISK